MKRVLIVDDEPITLKCLESLFRRQGLFEVKSVLNGLTAKELLSEQTFDVLITDHNMPGMTGEELMEWLYREGRIKEFALIIFNTSDLDQEMIENAKLKYGAKHFFKDVRPYHVIELLG